MKKKGENNGNLSSTPLQMDNDLMFASMINNTNKLNSDKCFNEINLSDDVKKNNETMTQLMDNVKHLNLSLSTKNEKNDQLNACLLKQTNICEVLNERLKKKDEEISLINEKCNQYLKENQQLKSQNGNNLNLNCLTEIINYGIFFQKKI
jgi:hypothetical protein